MVHRFSAYRRYPALDSDTPSGSPQRSVQPLLVRRWNSLAALAEPVGRGRLSTLRRGERARQRTWSRPRRTPRSQRAR